MNYIRSIRKEDLDKAPGCNFAYCEDDECLIVRADPTEEWIALDSTEFPPEENYDDVTFEQVVRRLYNKKLIADALILEQQLTKYGLQAYRNLR